MGYKVVSVNINGEVIETYKNFMEAANKTGFHVATLYWRANNKKPSPDGLIYLREGTYIDLFGKDRFEELFVKKKFGTGAYARSKRKVNHIVPYETKSKIICITPCPFICDYDGPRPKVGGSMCVSCPYFVTKDRDAHQVMCGYNKSGYRNTRTKQEG